MDLIEFDPLSVADPKTDSAGIFGGKVAKVIADRSYTAGEITTTSLLTHTSPPIYLIADRSYTAGEITTTSLLTLPHIPNKRRSFLNSRW